MQTFEEKLRDELERNFPKLNQNDPTKPSQNNRSAKLVFHAYALMILREAVAATKQDAIKKIRDWWGEPIQPREGINLLLEQILEK